MSATPRPAQPTDTRASQNGHCNVQAAAAPQVRPHVPGVVLADASAGSQCDVGAALSRQTNRRRDLYWPLLEHVVLTVLFWTSFRAMNRSGAKWPFCKDHWAPNAFGACGDFTIR